MDAERTITKQPRTDGTGEQKCKKCPRKSVKGLYKGCGLCPYHWAEAVWGKKWADTIYLEEAGE